MITVYGLNHKTAPLALREQTAFSTQEGLLRALVHLHREVDEIAILSTCNRVEFYAYGKAPEKSIRRFLNQTCAIPHKTLDEHFYLHQGRVAVRHLFTVAAGLDSMMLGEPQILGQVKGALAAARAARSAGPTLNRLFEMALRVGKQVRAETGISQQHLSIGQAAAELARSFFEESGVNPGEMLIIGAGEMATLAAKSLAQHGLGPVIVANRTYSRARKLAADLHGQAIRFEQVGAYLPGVDVVICASSAPHLVLFREQIRGALDARRGRPLFLIDIAIPRDIEAAAASLPGVELYNIDDLQGVCDQALRHRQQAADRALLIIAAVADAFVDWLQSRQTAPMLQQLQQQAEAIRQAEVQKTLHRLGTLSPAQQEAIQALSRALVKKMLRAPIIQLQAPVSAWPCPQYSQCLSTALNIHPTPSYQEVHQ